MPNLPAHIYLASQAASSLEHPTINQHLGSFLLGATAPDIRSIIKCRREQTHFATLKVNNVGEGVEAMFKTYPNLRHGNAVNQPTQAFIAGYINHLIADESWIVGVFRIYFDNHPTPINQMRAHMWDRAIQLEMDRVARVELNDMVNIRSLMDGAENDVSLDFIDPGTLTKWREWVAEFNSWEFSWERLHRIFSRTYGVDGIAHEMVRQFIDDLPKSLDQLSDILPFEKVSDYQNRAIQTSINFIKEYFSAVTTSSGASSS